MSRDRKNGYSLVDVPRANLSVYLLYLHRNVETVHEVPAENQGVDRREDGVYPACGDHHRLALLNDAFVTRVGLIAEEGFALRRAAHPVLIQLYVSRRRFDEVEHLLAAQHVVPYGRATEVNVKVGETVLDSHQAVLLHLRSLYVAFLGPIARPGRIHPVEFTRYVRRFDQRRETANVYF